MIKTRVDNDLMNYHHVLENKPQIEKSDIQSLLDGYREKFDVDVVFVAEKMLERNMVELTHESCRDGQKRCEEKKYYSTYFGDEGYIKFDEEGLCTYGLPPYDKDGENSIIHYGIFHNNEYIGSIGFLNFNKRHQWDAEERLAIQKLGRVLKSAVHLNRIIKLLAVDENMIDQQRHALDAFFSTTECGVLWHTLDGKKVLSVNQAALQILGYDSQEDLEKNFQLIAPSVVLEDREKVKATIRKLKKAGDSGNVGYQIKHRDGEVLDVMGRIKLFEDKGRLVCQRVIMDCTEQRLLEKKQLKDNENYWLEIVSALTQEYSSVFYLDADSGMGSAYRISKAAKNTFAGVMAAEISHSQLQGSYVNKYVHIEDRTEFAKNTSLETMRKRLQQENRYYVNYRIIKEDKSQEYYQAKIVRVGSWEKQHGVMIGFRSVDKEIREDIEQKKAMSDALKDAEQASQAKTSFLNSMSHDIRTPMNAIIGYTTLAKKHFDDREKVSDYLDKIEISSSHLLRLINDVLEMSRIESGKVTLEPASCNLRGLMDELQTVMMGQIQEKSLNFNMNTDNIQNEVVQCDKLRLTQVLLNVLGNAVKFTQEGGNIIVDVSQKFKCPKEGCAGYWFRIKDNGIGMSDEFKEHLFEQFSRENNTTVSGIPGTGLGMAITKRIVDMMEGKITVRSRLREGTEFIIDLNFPLQDNRPPEEDFEASGAPGSAKKNEASGKRKSYVAKKLLLVEDNAINQEIAIEILSEYGFNIDVANNGSEAVDKVKNSKPGHYYAVLMDIQMPVMNGYEATWRIRALEDKALAEVPIIAMTANAFEEDKKMALMAGMDDFVAKPVDVKNLLEALDRLDIDCGCSA
jgi:PAS domain S-box-containing protein